MAYNGSAVRIN